MNTFDARKRRFQKLLDLTPNNIVTAEAAKLVLLSLVGKRAMMRMLIFAFIAKKADKPTITKQVKVALPNVGSKISDTNPFPRQLADFYIAIKGRRQIAKEQIVGLYVRALVAYRIHIRKMSPEEASR